MAEDGANAVPDAPVQPRGRLLRLQLALQLESVGEGGDSVNGRLCAGGRAARTGS